MINYPYNGKYLLSDLALFAIAFFGARLIGNQPFAGGSFWINSNFASFLITGHRSGPENDAPEVDPGNLFMIITIERPCSKHVLTVVLL